MSEKRIIEFYNKKAKDYISFSERFRDIDKSKVIRLLRLEKEHVVLDAGCGSGFFTIGIRDFGCDVLGVDISDGMIDELQAKGIRGIVSPIELLNLEEKFDCILCYGLLEFVNDPKEVLLILKKHLAEGGCLVLGIPVFKIKSFLYILYHLLFNRKFVHVFSKSKIMQLLESAGFKIEEGVMINDLDYCCRAKKNE